MELIVLRSHRVISHDSVPVGTLSYEPGELSVEVEDVSRDRVTELRRDPRVVATAPPMPVQLVQPVDAPAEERVPEVSWGVEAVGAAASAYTGAGVTVAVLDTGIDRDWKSHPAFLGVDVVVKNFTSDAEHDVVGHGTHCAGTILGRTTEGCRIGVAPGVERVLIGKVLGLAGGSTDSIFKSILWAIENGAHVISMSLGMDFPAYQETLCRRMPAQLATSMALSGYSANVRLFDRLSLLTAGRDGLSQGVVVVAAAGNESRRDLDPEFRIVVAPPAAAEFFLSVSALGRSAEGETNPYVIAPFSNAGARVAAPGVDVVSAALGGGLSTKSGTSMAAPHVAGVAALWSEKLLKQGRPFHARQVVDRLEKSTRELPYLDPDDVSLGLVRAP
jgi:subtilisin family serine protease